MFSFKPRLDIYHLKSEDINAKIKDSSPSRADVLRRPNVGEKRSSNLITIEGKVTDWKQCAILGLTPGEIIEVRGGTGSRRTVKASLTSVRKQMRTAGWSFPANPEYKGIGLDDGLVRPFLRAVPPHSAAKCEADDYQLEIGEAASSWEQEVDRQKRSNWLLRLNPNKEPR
jgi:hypothetical protein